MSFDQWWAEWVRLASVINWPEGDKESFREHWKDGMTPEESLDLELYYARDDC